MGSTAATTSPRLLETALPAMKSDRSHTLTSQDSSTMSDSRYGEQAEVVDATPVDAARLSANLALWNDHEEAAPLSNQEEPDVVGRTRVETHGHHDKRHVVLRRRSCDSWRIQSSSKPRTSSGRAGMHTGKCL